MDTGGFDTGWRTMAYELGTPVGTCCLCHSADDFRSPAVTVDNVSVSYSTITQWPCFNFYPTGSFAAVATTKSCNLLRFEPCATQLAVQSAQATGSRAISEYTERSCSCEDGCSNLMGHNGKTNLAQTGSVSSVSASLSAQGALNITVNFTGTYSQTETGEQCYLPPDPMPPAVITTTTGSWDTSLNLFFQISCDNAGTGCDRYFSVWRDPVVFLCGSTEAPQNCPTNCTCMGPDACLNNYVFDPTDYATVDSKVKVVLVGPGGDTIFSQTVQGNPQLCGAYADAPVALGSYYYNTCRCSCDHWGDYSIECTENTTVTVVLGMLPA